MCIDTSTTNSKRQIRPNGFVMVIILVAIAFMGIFITKAIPNAVSEVQRDQEAELIFRGEAIVAAIRLYKKRVGDYPTRLEDLVDIQPKIIRKLYKDPMTISGPHSGDWNLIMCASITATAKEPGSLRIVGVRSYCTKDSKKLYLGKDLISDWTFSASDNDRYTAFKKREDE